MIQQADIKESQRLGDSLCKGYILTTRLSASRGVIMCHNNLRGKQFESPFCNQSMIDYRTLHTALANSLALNHTIGIGQIQHPALLVLQTLEQRSKDIDSITA